MDNINEMDYRLPFNNKNAADEVYNLAGLMDKQLRISPMMEQKTPLSNGHVEIPDVLQKIVSISDDEKRPAAKRQTVLSECTKVVMLNCFHIS